MKTCNKCRQELPETEFPFSKTGDSIRRIGFCHDCNVKVKAYNKQYREDPESAKVMSNAKKRWSGSEHGIAVTAAYRDSDMNKAAQSKYWKSPKGKVAVANRLKNHRHSIDLQIGFWHLLAGGRKTSSVVFFNTEFKSKHDVVNHIESVKLDSMHWNEYGVTWEIDHKIPRSEYNHDDPEDVLRCWSHENVRACCIRANRSKNSKVIPALRDEVPVSKWPKKWGA